TPFCPLSLILFFFTSLVPTVIYTLSLHDALPICWGAFWLVERTITAHDILGWYPRHSHNAYLQIVVNLGIVGLLIALAIGIWTRSEEHTSELQSLRHLVCRLLLEKKKKNIN